MHTKMLPRLLAIRFEMESRWYILRLVRNNTIKEKESEIEKKIYVVYSCFHNKSILEDKWILED